MTTTRPTLPWFAFRRSPETPPTRPTLRSALPFVVVALVGLGSVAAPPYREPTVWQPALLVAGFALLLVFLGFSLVRSERSWVDPIPAFLFFGLIALARDLGGGSTSGVEPLVALPILWLAMSGTRRDLAIAGVLTAALFVLPMAIIGGPQYPASDWRSAVLWIGVAALVAPVVRRLVVQLAEQQHLSAEANTAVEAILQASQLTSVVACELDGTVVSFSAGAEELLGYRAEDVVGKHGPEVFHDPDELAEVAAELGVPAGFQVFAALAAQRAPSRVWTYVTAAGNRRQVQLVVTELRDQHGSLYGYLRVAIDVTVSVIAQSNLAEAEARWRALMEHLPNMTVLMLDEDLRIQVAAGQGAKKQGLLGREGILMEEHSTPKNMALLRPMLEGAFRGEESSAETKSSATGAEHEFVVTPLPAGADGRPHALIVGRDVSQERQRARELQASSERAERLFTDAPHGVALLRPDTSAVRLNHTMSQWLGDDTQRPLSELAAPGQEDVLGVHLAEAVSRRPALVRTDWEVVQPDGHELHLALSSRSVHDIEEGAQDVVLVNAVDVSERRTYERRLAHLADHDALTGLANRRKFDHELRRHQEWCQRYGSTGALLLLDLDHFKDVNDSLGHHSGDQLIVSTAAVVRGAVRATDLVARVGGDEFAVLLTQGGREAAAAVGNNLVEKVRQHTATFDGTRRRVSASIGGVTFADADRSGTEILGLADMMMYDAKEAGRDQCLILDREQFSQPRMSARLQWRDRIERALENDDFVLHLQPILDLSTGQVRSAEALLRMNDDGLVPPSRFLYVAEQTGLAPAVDEWVVGNSIELLTDLRQRDPEFNLEINLSGHSMNSDMVEHAIVDHLAAHRVDPSALILEITETAAVADIEAARAFAQRMTTLGCKFALDDFGAGFGSFYYLKHLLFDFVKIDGEFIANCSTSAVDRTILRSIVGIAQGLGKRTVAEFVTDADVLDVVRAEGVDLAQGFEIGRPVPPAEFVATWLGKKADTSQATA